MKIAMIGTKGIPARSGGVERHVEAIATRLARAGHEVIVYTRPWYTRRESRPRRWRGVRLLPLPSLTTKHFDAITHTLLASLDVLRRDVDVVHYHGVGPSLLLWIPKLFSRATVVATFHCQDYHHQKWNWFARLMLRLGEWSAVTFADETVVVSRELERYVWTAYQRRATYIPNGVSHETSISKHEAQKRLRRFGLEPSNYILFAGRLVRHKGAHTLIEAYRQSHVSLPLVIVGAPANTSTYEVELHELAKGLPVKFLGEQTGRTLATLLEHARLLVHPSISEGMSLVLLEAMAVGTPVLVSDIPENRELLGAGQTLFRADDRGDATMKLAWCLNHPKTMARRARDAKHRTLTFNWDDVTGRLADRYAEAVWITSAKTLKLQAKAVR